MRRPPYPALVATGVLVTTLDETKRLPTRILTFPMTAISRGLQAGMRLQQNIAEMAIKGDEFFAPYCDKAEEQPAWARFDEDDEMVISIPSAVSESSAPVAAPSAPADEPARQAPARKAPARKPAAQKPSTVPATDGVETEAPAATGRFALYSTPPAEVVAEAEAPAPTAAGGDQPEVVVLLDYDVLTLAQLRAKLRGLSVDDLQELADYERAHRDRTPFATMIDNRIASHQKKSGA